MITANGGPARLLRNDGGNTNGVLRVETRGVTSNRDGIGTRVEVTAGGETRWQMVKTGSSYASQSERPLTFGLGASRSVTALRVTWPNGQVETIGDVDANQHITVEEDRGIVHTTLIVRDR